MTIIDILGVIAAITSVAGFFPQIYKIHQTKSVDDLSTLMLLNFVICSLAWTAYGALTNSFYVFSTNVVGLIVSAVLFSQKLYYASK